MITVFTSLYTLRTLETSTGVIIIGHRDLVVLAGSRKFPDHTCSLLWHEPKCTRKIHTYPHSCRFNARKASTKILSMSQRHRCNVDGRVNTWRLQHLRLTHDRLCCDEHRLPSCSRRLVPVVASFYTSTLLLNFPAEISALRIVVKLLGMGPPKNQIGVCQSYSPQSNGTWAHATRTTEQHE